MGAKRYHQKSKLGCTNCRQRRIKCDETQGGCLKCKKRDYLCSLRPQKAAQGPATSNALLLRQQVVLAPSPTGSDFTNALLQQDAYNRLSYTVRPHAGRLFYYFASNTVTSMGYGTTVQQAWCTAIPDLALKHDFVAHGVLAVTALHISTTLDSMEAKQTYMQMAALELNVGLRQYMRQLSKVSRNNVEALFAFSTILSVFGSSQAANNCQRLITPEPSASRGTQTNILEAVNVVSHAVRTIRGAQVILVPGWNTLQDGPLRNVVMRESWDNPPPVSSAHADEDRRLAILELMWSNPQRTYEDHFETLRQTWQSLRATFKIVWSLKENTSPSHASSGPSFDWTSIFHFAFSCSLDFLNLIEQQCMEAWVLAAHYGCLVMEINGLWWVGPSARNLVATAALVIGTQNWEWLAWPAAVVGINLESLRQLALDRPRICP